MNKVIPFLFITMVGCGEAAVPNYSPNASDFSGFGKSDRGSGVVSTDRHRDRTTEGEESPKLAPGKQLGTSPVSEFISFAQPSSAVFAEALIPLRVNASQNIGRVEYVVWPPGGATPSFIAESSDDELGFESSFEASFVGEYAFGARAFDDNGVLLGTAWKGLFFNGGDPSLFAAPSVKFMDAPAVFNDSVLTLSVATQGPVHSVRYTCQTPGGKIEWNMGESFETQAGFSIAFSFGFAGERILKAQALDHQGNVLAEESIQVLFVFPPSVNGYPEGKGCMPGQTADCQGTCAPVHWIGDGVCDEGLYGGADFFCAAFSADEGDCSTVQSETGCPNNSVPDCDGNCANLNWIEDGSCDDGETYLANFDCSEFDFDGGDCDGGSSSEGSSHSYFYQLQNEFYPTSSGPETALAILLADQGWMGTPDDLLNPQTGFGVGAYTVEELSVMFNAAAGESGLGVHSVPVNEYGLDGLQQRLASGESVLVFGQFDKVPHAVVATYHGSGEYVVRDPRGKWSEVFQGGYLSSYDPTIGNMIAYPSEPFEIAIGTSNGYLSDEISYLVVVAD